MALALEFLHEVAGLVGQFLLLGGQPLQFLNPLGFVLDAARLLGAAAKFVLPGRNVVELVGELSLFAELGNGIVRLFVQGLGEALQSLGGVAILGGAIALLVGSQRLGRFAKVVGQGLAAGGFHRLAKSRGLGG